MVFERDQIIGRILLHNRKVKFNNQNVILGGIGGVCTHKTNVDPFHLPIIDEEETNVPSKGWTEMILKVYEIDPLLCPCRGGKMRIISFIENPKLIDKIIRHLKLTFQAERASPPKFVQHELLMTVEDSGVYF